MDDEADVRLVDTHAESDGGDNHIHFFHQEGVLVVGARGSVHAGMVRQCLDAVDGQQLGDLLDLLAAEAVNDAALAGIFLDELDDVTLGIRLVADFIVEVLAIEGILEYAGIQHAEVLLDVGLDLRGRRGRQGDDRRTLDLADDFTDAAVFRAEIMAPFGDAVGLVNGIEGDLQLLEQLDVFFFSQRFGRDIEQFGQAGKQVRLHFGDLGLVERGVQEMCNAHFVLDEAANGIDLVFHQGDER